MSTIILLSCGKSKQSCPCKAKDMYTGALFKKSLQVATKLHPNAIYILSAKYGVLGLNEYIEPYNLTLNSLTERERESWAKKAMQQLKKRGLNEKDLLLFFAGENYRKHLMEMHKNSKCPIIGLPLGKQLQFYNKILTK